MNGIITPAFGAGDPVYILPKYAHLYPAKTGRVIGVVPDRHRPIFNEYVVQFADGSQITVMEFQIIEDVLNYTTDIAHVTLPSQHNGALRGSASSGQMILQTAGYDIDMTIRATTHTTIMGQVIERGTTNLLNDLDVRLMKESMLITVARSDSVGAFEFRNVPSGTLNILVVIPQTMTRILGTFPI